VHDEHTAIAVAQRKRLGILQRRPFQRSFHAPTR
jgi:hypothetical protein